MKTMTFALMMLTATATAQAHPAQHHVRSLAPSAASFVGLQPSVSSIDMPRMGRNDCNGEPCTSSGGPSGGNPNQN